MVQEAHKASGRACEEKDKTVHVAWRAPVSEKNERLWFFPKAKTRGEKANAETRLKIQVQNLQKINNSF